MAKLGNQSQVESSAVLTWHVVMAFANQFIVSYDVCCRLLLLLGTKWPYVNNMGDFCFFSEK